MVITRKEIAAKRALIDAIEIGDIRAVRKHLDNGADANATDKDDVDGSQHSLLILAICQHQFEVAKELVERGADVSTIYMNYDVRHSCIYRITAFKAAKIIYDENFDTMVGEILKIIENELSKLEGKDKHRIMPANLPPASNLPVQVLIDAVSEGDIECINLLLDYGMDINKIYRDTSTNKQQSVLIFAIFVNQIDTARMLIERGADLDTIFQNYDSDKQIIELTALQAARECMFRTQTPPIEQLVKLISNELMKRMDKQPRIVQPFEENTFCRGSTPSVSDVGDVDANPIDETSMESYESSESRMTNSSNETIKSTTCTVL